MSDEDKQLKPALRPPPDTLEMNHTFEQRTDSALNASGGDEGQTALRLPTFSAAAKARVVITFTLCAVSAACNLAVLWAASSGARRKSHVRILIINLTVADLLVTFIVMPVDAAWNMTVQWRAGDLACRLLMFLKLVAMYSCAFVTVVISLDRHSAILNPLAISEAKKKSKMMLSAAWIMSVVFSVPQVFIFHNVTITVPTSFTQCTTRGSFTKRWQETLYNMFTFVCLFLLPLVIMIFCYTCILVEISQRMTKGHKSSTGVHLRCSINNIPKARMRTLKMSIVIVTSFIVCWTPYYLLGLWYWFLPDDLEETVSHSLTHMLFIFGLFNAILDPITYGLFTIHFRKGLTHYGRGRTTLAEPESNTVLTGSLKCSPSSLRMKRLTQEGREMEDTEGREGRKPGPHRNILIVHDRGGGERNQSAPESI
ncbi:gonadotropin releasing hormone receptor 4 [Brachyhypopomus gauderio]|uniref:gonadotropin releasing hormone receptor 4 n=1 Tax=Brachyhypopomus gauderio TaxID=698409 RepID=UPI004041EB8D